MMSRVSELMTLSDLSNANVKSANEFIKGHLEPKILRRIKVLDTDDMQLLLRMLSKAKILKKDSEFAQ